MITGAFDLCISVKDHKSIIPLLSMKGKKMNMKKIAALLIALICFAQTFAYAVAVDVNGEADNLVNYYKANKKSLEMVDETYALAAAGVDFAKTSISTAPVDEDDLNTNYFGTAAKLILTAIAKGEDPKTAVKGKNIVDELASKQGADGSFGNVYTHIYAVFALKACKKSFDEDKAAQFIISKQLSDGGYSYNDQLPGDIDTTALLLPLMALFKDKAGMSQCKDKAIQFVLSKQNSTTGGFESWGADNSNTLAAVITGLTDCGIDVTRDEYKNMQNALIRFKNPDGTYKYKINDKEENNALATAQVLWAFDALRDGKSFFMTLAETGKFNKAEQTVNNTSSENSSGVLSKQTDTVDNTKTADSTAYTVIILVAAAISMLVISSNLKRVNAK